MGGSDYKYLNCHCKQAVKHQNDGRKRCYKVQIKNVLEIILSLRKGINTSKVKLMIDTIQLFCFLFCFSLVYGVLRSMYVLSKPQHLNPQDSFLFF
jgi:hypothetical protein